MYLVIGKRWILPYNGASMKALRDNPMQSSELLSLPDKVPDIRRWFLSEAGQALLASEQALIDTQLETLFGYYCLQLSCLPDVCLHQQSKVRRKFSFHPLVDEQALHQISASANFTQLPVAADSIDVAVVHHVLEYSHDPHAVLRELNRVILPSGHLVIIGFSPFSSYGLRAVACRKKNDAMWQFKALQKSRLHEWLSLLGFSIVHSKVEGYKFAAASDLFHKYQLPGGAFYIVVAQKQASTITPLKTKHRKLKRQKSLGVAPGVLQQYEKDSIER